MTAPRRILTALLLILTAALAHAQAYDTIVVIGDSLSDTGNDTKLSTAAYTAAAALPAPATGYTQGSFTNGTDTSPATRLYTGVWIKQLAARLAATPPVIDSLDGGTNYAYGFAFTGTGTSTLAYGPANAFSINVNNMGTQLATYLATKPTITSKTLFVVWGGSNDLLNASGPAAITTAVTNELGIIQTLIANGATDFIIPNIPPLGTIPRLNTIPGSAAAATAAAQAFNQGLAAGLATLPAANPTRTLHLFPLDVYTLFNTIITSPATYGFTNTTASAQGNSTINPDTYVYWDGLHPTTAGHRQLALAALALIAPTNTTTTITASANPANFAAPITFTATVSSIGGIPPGTVTFLDGTTPIGNAQLSGTATNVATFTTSSLTAGTHSITASYVASQYFNASTSTALSEVIVPPAIVASANPAALTIQSGSTGTATISVATSGGLTGSVALSCGPLPVTISCSFAPASLSFSGANNTLTSTLTINTVGPAFTRLTPIHPFSNTALRTLAVCSLLPFFGLVALRRKSLRRTTLLTTLLLVLSSGAVLGMSGCSGNSANNAAAGQYTIPINLAGGGATSSLSFVVTVTK